MISTMEIYSLGRDPRPGTGAATRLDLSESDQGLGLEALGEGADGGRAGGDAPPPAWPRREQLPKLEVEAMWVYHPLISARLGRITKLAGVELIAWTVDDLPQMRRLVERGVDGICSNDPRLFAELELEWRL